MKQQYLFVLGRTPKLAQAELRVLTSSPTLLRPDIILSSSEHTPTDLMQLLGGTMKVCEVVYTGAMPTIADLSTLLFQEVKDTKLVFGMSIYSEIEPFATKALFALKEEFVGRGIHTRFIESKHGTPLSSVVITKQKVSELIVVQSDTTWYVAVTRAAQDFEQWNERDFGRPFSDPKNGMLPPKVARMIVNIAKGAWTKTTRTLKEIPVLLDPFCGTGTILVEALSIGWHVIGADISSDAVAKTRKNLAWARAHFALTPDPINVFTHDATHISDVVVHPVHAIVTEPYMGNTNASSFGRVIEREKAKNIIKGLEKLYIGCLREWSKILVKDGIIVMALPQYTIGRETLFVKKVIDRCEILGYTLLDGPIEYGRPDAVVRREFFVFKKKS